EDAKPSAGQMVLAPVHVSATSQTPADARHSAAALPAGCWQVTFVPSHWSSEHGLPSDVHAVPLGLLASAGHAAAGMPVQFSARSHSPAALRQVKPVPCTTSAGHVVLAPVQVSVGSQGSPAQARE